MVKIVDGKFEANEILEYTKKNIEYIIENFGKRPKLVTVLVGDNQASKIYVNAKIKKSKEVGINADFIPLEKTTDKFQLIKLINSLNSDDDINAILVQLPLPKPLDNTIVYKHINHEKDVDAFGFLNAGLLIHKKSFILPCTPFGILYILKKYIKNLSGKKAIIIGCSIIVGKPIASILLNENCTIICTHSKTQDLKKECQSADIIIAAAGVPKLVKEDWVKNGSFIIDVGINRDINNKIIGDVDFENVKNKAGFITSVPGGIGPLTVASLMYNTLKLFCRQNNFEITDLGHGKS